MDLPKSLLEFAGHAAEKSLSIPITFVQSVEKQMTSQTQCKGSDKQVVGSAVKLKGSNFASGMCPICDQEVAIRYATLPPRETHSGLKMAAAGMWVTLPHEKPFAARCANCGAGLYENDYLCQRCRRASLAE
jgi:hypothetical protein